MMKKTISTLTKVRLASLSLSCLLIVACEQRDSTDLVEKGGYPRTYPVLSPKSTMTPLEKPNVEEEFFDAEKLM